VDLRRHQRELAAVAGCVVLGWLGLRGGRVPLLSAADLGFHELGHLICYLVPFVGPLVTAAAGSAMQLAVPLGLAIYFLVVRHDNAAAAVCAAWAATDAADVARYIADAPFERLPLIGGDHDWAFFFSADGIDAMDRAAGVAHAVATLGWLLFATSFLVALWPVLADWVRAGDRPLGPRGSRRDR